MKIMKQDDVIKVISSELTQLINLMIGFDHDRSNIELISRYKWRLCTSNTQSTHIYKFFKWQTWLEM